MNILVTGAGGQLGSELQALAKNEKDLHFHFTDYPEVDITATDSLKERFAEQSYDYCINCAAYTAVDKAEEEKEKCDAINVTGSQNLADLCKAHDVVLVHISTDFVFNGVTHLPLQENDLTSPLSHYGLSKLNGENAIRETWEKHFIFRTSWLYSSYGANFVKTMIRLSETKDELSIIADQVGTPTYAKDLAEVIVALIKTESDAFGLYHYSNEGVASWYDFAAAVFEYKNLSVVAKPIPTEAYPTPAKRPHFSVMDKSKFKKTFGYAIPHWRTSLKKCLELL